MSFAMLAGMSALQTARASDLAMAGNQEKENLYNNMMSGNPDPAAGKASEVKLKNTQMLESANNTMRGETQKQLAQSIKQSFGGFPSSSGSSTA